MAHDERRGGRGHGTRVTFMLGTRKRGLPGAGLRKPTGKVAMDPRTLKQEDRVNKKPLHRTQDGTKERPEGAGGAAPRPDSGSECRGLPEAGVSSGHSPSCPTATLQPRTAHRECTLEREMTLFGVTRFNLQFMISYLE